MSVSVEKIVAISINYVVTNGFIWIEVEVDSSRILITSIVIFQSLLAQRTWDRPCFDNWSIRLQLDGLLGESAESSEGAGDLSEHLFINTRTFILKKCTIQKKHPD